MESQKAQASVENGKSGTKKAYWKPSVQVYGQLADVTQAGAAPTAKKLDNGGWSPTHRT